MRKIFTRLFNSSTSSEPAKLNVQAGFYSLDGAPVSSVLNGTPIKFVASSLPPDKKATITTSRGQWRSRAVFEVGADGTIDTAVHAPIEGTYTGVDPDGPLWSMKPDVRGAPATEFKEPVQCTVEVDGQLVFESRITFYSAIPGVTSRRLLFDEHSLVGMFSLPPGEGPFPAVLTVGGSDGGFSKIASEYYASHGFACLTLAYFAETGLPGDLGEIPLEYFEKAIQWLLEQKNVNPGGVMLIGTSRGGELVLLLGSQFPKVRGVIAVTPSCVSWGGYGGKAAWTYQGKDFSHVPLLGAEPEWEVAHDGVLSLNYTVMFEKAMENKEAVEKAMIPVEQINGPVLFIGGGDDRLWPAVGMIEISMQRMKNRPHKDQALCFPNAGHRLGVPGLPTTNIADDHPVSKKRINLGGTPIENARAQRQTRDAILHFLRENSIK